MILTGASGAGKTTIAREFAKRYSPLADVLFFDSIGVPSPDEMVSGYGSGEEWQRAKTWDWLAEMSARLLDKPILFEGQMRLAFIHEAARAVGISNYEVILVDCDDRTRRIRLTIDRQQPELACNEMMSWAHVLREEAKREGDTILDTSGITVSEAVEAVHLHF